MIESSSMIFVIAMLLFGILARRGGIFKGIKRPYVDGADTHVPSSTLNSHTMDAEHVPPTQAHVPQIILSRTIPKVFKAVVRAIAVDVVDIIRVNTHHPLECNAVGMNLPIENRALQVTVGFLVAKRRLTSVALVPDRSAVFGRVQHSIGEHRCWSLAPCQRSSLRIIIQKLAQRLLVRQFSWSHSELTFRCGQGLALLTQRLRPVFHSRIPVCSQANANPSILSGKTVGDFVDWLERKTGDRAK